MFSLSMGTGLVVIISASGFVRAPCDWLALSTHSPYNVTGRLWILSRRLRLEVGMDVANHHKEQQLQRFLDRETGAVQPSDCEASYWPSKASLLLKSRLAPVSVDDRFRNGLLVITPVAEKGRSSNIVDSNYKWTSNVVCAK